MAKNLHMTQDSQITVAMPVPDGTTSGQVVRVGSDGLVGYAITDRMTQAVLDDPRAFATPGLKPGEASVTLIGIGLSVNLELDGGSVGERVYLTPGGAYSGTASGNTAIGFRLATTTGTGLVPVGLTKG